MHHGAGDVQVRSVHLLVDAAFGLPSVGPSWQDRLGPVVAINDDTKRILCSQGSLAGSPICLARLPRLLEVMQQAVTRLRVFPETLRVAHLALDHIARFACRVRRLRPELQALAPSLRSGVEN